MDSDSSTTTTTTSSSTAIVTQSALDEEERLEAKAAQQQQKQLQELTQALDVQEEKRKLLRLEALLQKSSMYSTFLINRMQAQRSAGSTVSSTSNPDAQDNNDDNDGAHDAVAVGSKRKHSPNRSSADQNQHKRQRVSNDSDNDSSSSSSSSSSQPQHTHLLRQPELVTGGVLREYQLQGVEWLISLYENGLNGILADEMGLGKTLQTISLLAHLRSHQVWGPFLIVAPLSTIHNWFTEIEKFTPDIPALVYHGSKQERAQLRKKRMRTLDATFPIVITSYNIFMNDRKFLQRYNWRFLVVDEGQRLKNLNCKLVQELKAIPSANRVLLTGTPLQNSLSELWSLLNFVMPQIFADLDTFQSFFDVISIQEDADLSVDQQRILEQEQKNQIVSKLHQILKPFLLRRLKVDVETQMPRKKEVIVYTPLTNTQHEYYEATLDRTLRALISQKASRASGPGQAAAASGILRDPISGESIRLSNVLMQLRKVCNHPYLFHWPSTEHDHNELLIDQQLIDSAGKTQLLQRMLARLKADGHKVLIFSQFTRMLDILQDMLTLSEYAHCRLDGATPHEERVQQMHDFNTDPDCFVFLLSTRAGGLGINLVAADTVIFYDSDWNPQADIQAQDRAHRIGQTRPVMVYRLVTGNSVEQRILERANAKRTLEKLVTSGDFKGLLQGNRSSHNAEDRIQLDDLVHILTNNEIDDVGGLDAMDNMRKNARAHRGGKQLTHDELDQLMDRDAWFDTPDDSDKPSSATSDSSHSSASSTSKRPTRSNAFAVVEQGGSQVMRIGATS